MSKSKLMIGVIGLAAMIAPIQVASSQIVDECMETDIQTRTKEITSTEEVVFIGTHSEFIPEEIEVREIVDEWIDINLHISYYTDLQIENTPGKETTDAQSNPLVYGTIAVPRDISLDTKFIIEGYDNEFVARDRGSRKYIKWLDDDTIKIDMYIPPNSNENEDAYFRRVNNLGVTKTKGKYLLQKE